MLVSVVGDAVLAGCVDPVPAEVDNFIDVVLPDWEVAVDVEAGTEAEVVAGLDELGGFVAVVVLPSGWDEPGKLGVEVPPGSGSGVAVQLLMLSTGLPTSDILLLHSGVEQLWKMSA